jgi:hypothetical protein
MYMSVETWQFRVSMPVNKDYWDEWHANPENGLYHATSPDRLESIMQHGLHPWDSPIAGGSRYEPEALIPGKWGFDSNDEPPREIAWRPMEWPRRTSAAMYTPWQWGEWGRGIYYPETGVLQTWSDDRSHLDVWNDDENYSQPGGAHHIVIRPNGTVHDQGAFARDFGDTETDVPGLQQALKELDPRLRLDSSNDWSFGPTEPMEEEPSSVSRGEDGGTEHGVQTANDFAGSL